MANFKACCFSFPCLVAWITLLLAAGSLVGVILLSYHQSDGCPKVRSCYYQVHSTLNDTLYNYYYVINNQYTCSNFCSNPLELTSCPNNGSTCEVTNEVKDFCKYQGFGYLVLVNGCFNQTNFWLFWLCLLFVLMCLVCACACARISHSESKRVTDAQGNTPATPVTSYVPQVDSNV